MIFNHLGVFFINDYVYTVYGVMSSCLIIETVSKETMILTTLAGKVQSPQKRRCSESGDTLDRSGGGVK